MLNARMKSLAEKILPPFLLAWLDPVQQIIDSEVADTAARACPGQVILDAGAGEARHKGYFTQGRYIALDAAAGNPDWNYSRLDVRGDLERLPLRACSVDHILCMVVLEHVRNPHRAIAEFARVLKPGGSIKLVVPFLWEEHQVPGDYFRFTRYGVRMLFEPHPLHIDLLNPMGGFFWLLARRSINLLGFFQRGWLWLFFVLLTPLFGFVFPLLLFCLDGLDREKHFSLGFQVRVTKEQEYRSPGARA